MKQSVVAAFLALAVLDGHAGPPQAEPEWWKQARALVADQETVASGYFFGWANGAPLEAVLPRNVTLSALLVPHNLQVVEGWRTEASHYIVARLPDGQVVPLGGFPAPAIADVWNALAKTTDVGQGRLQTIGRHVATLANDWSSTAVFPRECVRRATMCPDSTAALAYLRSESAQGIGDTVIALGTGKDSRQLVHVDALYREYGSTWFAQHWTFLANQEGELLAWTRSGGAQLSLPTAGAGR